MWRLTEVEKCNVVGSSKTVVGGGFGQREELQNVGSCEEVGGSCEEVSQCVKEIPAKLPQVTQTLRRIRLIVNTGVSGISSPFYM